MLCSGGAAMSDVGSTTREVVVGVDGSRGSTAALTWALEAARERHAPLRLVYAWHYPPLFHTSPLAGLTEAVVDEGRQLLDRSLKEVPGATEPGVTVHREVDCGGAA